MELLKSLLLLEAKQIDVSSLKNCGEANSLAMANKIKISGEIKVIECNYFDHPSITNTIERAYFKAVSNAAKNTGGKAVRTSFSNYQVTGITTSKFKEFTKNLNSELNEEGYHEPNDVWSLNIIVYC